MLISVVVTKCVLHINFTSRIKEYTNPVPFLFIGNTAYCCGCGLRELLLLCCISEKENHICWYFHSIIRSFSCIYLKTLSTTIPKNHLFLVVCIGIGKHSCWVICKRPINK